MDPKVIQTEIRLLISSIRMFIQRIPQDKQVKATIKLKNAIKSLTPSQSPKDLDQVLEQLRYQANFLKLTNPQLKFENNDMVDQETEQLLSKEMNELEERFDAKIENQIEGSGTYIFKDGKLVKGQAEKKVKVDFTNWHAGNVDPEDLRKHRELLDRMNFRGPFWEGKPQPKSILDEANPFQMQFDDENKPEPEMHPSMTHEKAEHWEKVKR